MTAAVSNLAANDINVNGSFNEAEKRTLRKITRAATGVLAVTTADSAVNNTTTYADSSLVIRNLKAGTRYRVEGVVYLTNDTVADSARVRLNLSGTGNASAPCNLFTTAIGNTTVTTVRNYAFSSNVAEVAVVADATSGVSVNITGIISVLADGTLTVQYAEEAASGGTGAVLKANSFLRVTPVEF
jgi:hypothetical protein